MSIALQNEMKALRELCAALESRVAVLEHLLAAPAPEPEVRRGGWPKGRPRKPGAIHAETD